MFHVKTMFISASEFNQIPHVSLTHEVFYETEDVRNQIDVLISKYGLEFKPCSLHRHFPIKDGQILLIEKITLNNGDEIELAKPVDIENIGEVHPISYYVTKEGNVRPYKYARGPSPNIDENFFKELSQILLNTDEYSRVSIKRPTSYGSGKITEAEIPEYNATVLFPMKYTDFMSDEIQHKETAKNESHSKTVRGTHFVMFAKDPNIISEAIFPVLAA